MKVVRLGRSARNASGMKVRQPLAKVTVKPSSKSESEAVVRNERLILDELNIKGLVLTEDATGLVGYTIKPNLRTLGPKHGKILPKITIALAEADGSVIAARVAAGEPFDLVVAGETLALDSNDVIVETTAPENLSCAEESATVVAIDTQLTDELIQEGMVRDLVRQIQNMRKDSEFNVDDRITIEYSATGNLSEAIEAWSDYIRQETLANSLTPGDDSLAKVKIAGEEIGLSLAKA